MIGITFDMDNLRDRVLGFVAQGVNDHTTTNRAVGTSAARLGRTCNLQALRLRINRSQTEAEHTNTHTSNQGCLDEGSSRDFHTSLRLNEELDSKGSSAVGNENHVRHGDRLG